MLHQTAHFLSIYRKQVFIGLLLLLGGMAFFTRLPVLSGNLQGFDMEDNEFFTAGNEVEALFGSEQMVYLSIRPQNQDSRAVFKGVRELENTLVSEFKNATVTSLRPAASLMLSGTEAPKPIRPFLQQMAGYPALENLISKDRYAFLLLLNVDSVTGFSPEKLTPVLQKKYPGILEVKALSLFHVESAIEAAIRQDLAVLSLVISCFFIAFLYFAFRSIKVILFSYFIVGFSLFCALFFFSIFGIGMNLVTVLVIPVALVMSLADALHLITGYFTFRQEENVTGQALIYKVVQRYLVPSFFSSATTAAAFYSFVFFNDSEFIRQFGLLTGTTVMAEFLITFLATPYLLQFIPDWHKPAAEIFSLTNFLEMHQRKIAFGFLALIPLSLLLVPKLRFNTHPEMFFPVNSDLYQTHEEFKDNYYSQIRCDVLVTPQKRYANAAEKSALEKVVRELAATFKQQPEVVRVNAATNPSPDFLMAGIPLNFNKLLGKRNPYISPDGQVYRLEIRFRNADDIKPFYEKMAPLKTRFEDQYRISFASPALLLDHIDQRVSRSLLASLLTSGFSIALILLLLTRSLTLTLIGLIPNLIPLALVAIIFYVFKLEINILTAITAVVCLGLLDDDTVHVLYRMLHLKLPLNELGFSIFSTSVLLATGFGLFVLSSFRPTQVFGAVSASVFLAGVICEITLLPFLIRFGLRLTLNKNKND